MTSTLPPQTLSITRSSSSHGNLLPRAFDWLAAAPDAALHHTAHRLRHPLGIYNESLSRVFGSLAAVLDELSAITSSGQERGEQLLAAHDRFLASMAAHIDDCYMVLKATHPAATPKGNPIFVHKWLEAVGHPTVGAFEHSLKPYREILAAIVNRLKHRNGRLRLVLIRQDEEVHPGYFLEGAFPDGDVGPDPEVHPMQTARSFAHDLRFHVAHLYAAGEWLYDALAGAHAQSAEPIMVAEAPWDEVACLMGRIGDLPGIVFPDERRKATPSVSVSRDQTGAVLHVATPGQYLPSFSGPVRISVSMRGDGATRGFRLPYPPGVGY